MVVLKDGIRIGLLPVGDIDMAGAKEDLNTALEGLKGLKLDVIDKPATSDPHEVTLFSKQLETEEVCLLTLFCLHGMQSANLVLAAERTELPVVIWALPVRYSFPTSASAIGNLKERGLRAKLIYGAPNAESALNEILRASKAAYTIKMLRRARIGQIGALQYSNVASNYDRYVLRDRLGPEIVQISINELTVSFNKITDEEVNREFGDISRRFPVEIDEADLKKAIKLHLAIKRLYEGYGLSGVTLECYTELGRTFCTNPCLGFIENMVIGCEGDVVQCVASLLVKYLTGKAAYAADLFSVNYDRSLLSMVHCSAPAALAEDPSKALVGAYRPPMTLGSYVMAVCKPQIPPGPVTIFRLFGRNLDKIHLTMGELASYEFDPALKVNVKVTGDVKKFVKNVSGNHYLLVPGNIKEELYELCDWLKVQIIET